MRAALLSRLQRLETRSGGMQKPMRLMIGPLRRLPSDYKGERKVVITKREPTNESTREDCEFEERPGPGQEPDFGDHTMVVYLITTDQ